MNNTSMNRVAELVKAIIVLPGPVLVLIPGILLYSTRPFTWFGGTGFPEAWAFLGAGLLFLAAGLFFAVRTVSLFLTEGDGTPAPWAPPRRFVVSGPYRYVRNPMILSVLSILLGESVVCGSLAIFIWCAVFWLMNTVYFILIEEPGLTRRFGPDYLEYRRNVGRWIPRLTPWTRIAPKSLT